MATTPRKTLDEPVNKRENGRGVAKSAGDSEASLLLKQEADSMLRAFGGRVRSPK